MKFPRPSRTVLVAVATAIAVLVPSLGLTAAYAYAGDVPRGTTVLGIDIGAMSRAQATEALRAGLAAHAEALAAPVEVQIGDARTQLVPEQVGLAVDVEATVAGAATGWGNPLPALFGTRQVPPVVTVDAGKLDEALRKTAKKAGEAMTMPEIRFDGTTPVPVYPEPGLGLDPQRAAGALADHWPRLPTGDGQWRQPSVIAIPLVEIDPVTTAEDVDRLIAEFAEPAVAAPVSVRVPGGSTITVSPEAIAKSLRLTADERGEIIPAVRAKALRKAIAGQLGDVERQPKDATVELTGDGPQVVDSRDGKRVDMQALADELLGVLPQPDPRTVEATMTTAKPDFTTKDAAGLGIKEQISTFTTYFEGGLASPRNHNIALTADIVDGAVVKPGKVFSLNGYTGERGYDQGFKDAPVILNGKLVPAVGGGISQFTTTLFNASYYAGLEDVEHHPHSYHYSRYPSVIESTIFYPTLDMQFRNNTDHGVLIDTSYNNESITVSMWSTPVWDEVTTEWSAKRNFVQPKTQYLKPGPDCIATTGIEGYTQDAWRIFIRDGQEVKRERFTWRYDAQPEFICGKKPDD